MSSKLKLKSNAGGSLSLIVDDALATDEEFNVSLGGIESGSNANGSYIKFPDGTLICTGQNTNGNAVTFPMAFISTPNVTACGRNSSALADNTLSSYSVYGITNVGMAAMYARYYNMSTKTGGISGDTISYQAIGRWK